MPRLRSGYRAGRGAWRVLSRYALPDLRKQLILFLLDMLKPFVKVREFAGAFLFFNVEEEARDCGGVVAQPCFDRQFAAEREPDGPVQGFGRIVKHAAARVVVEDQGRNDSECQKGKRPLGQSHNSLEALIACPFLQTSPLRQKLKNTAEGYRDDKSCQRPAHSGNDECKNCHPQEKFDRIYCSSRQLLLGHRA